MKLSFLAKELEGARITKDAEFFSLCTDSRVSENGDLFFCFEGSKCDSHAFAAEAERRGASAVVCERELPVSLPQLVVADGREAMALISAIFYSHPEKGMKFVGITGTNGKTTTAFLVRSILEHAGKKAGLIGTLGAYYGEKEVAPDLTTPDPVALFSLLADMRRDGVDVVVMEVSAHALALKKVKPILFDVAIFTNLTQDHLDFFGDMERYFAAKKELFTSAQCKFAVLNSDDPHCSALAKSGIPHVSYGLETPADAFAIVESETVRGSRLLLNLNDDLAETTLRLTGRHNVYNALAAAVAARRLGAKLNDIAEGIAAVKSVSGRLEWVASYHGADIFVDFAHTPDGLQKSLAALRAHAEGRLICLFGCGGNRDKTKRPLMGKTAAKGCDFAVITSDNPRYEDPCEIIAQIEEGYRAYSDKYVLVEEREKATEYALNSLKEGDILLVAGKGGETYQEIMGIKYDYDDKNIIKSLLGTLS